MLAKRKGGVEEDQEDREQYDEICKQVEEEGRVKRIKKSDRQI